MSSYGFLAGSYDTLTRDVDYEDFADFLEKLLKQHKCPEMKTVLDLACGTGTLTCLMAERGYEMLGVDLSEDMLAEAAEKARELDGAEPPIFLHQAMEKLDLYGTIDGCVSSLDSMNYVTRPAALRRAFARVHLFLMPGGVFVFDVKTPQALAKMDGQIFLDETEDTYCVWRGEFSEKRHICSYFMDVFRKDGKHWVRGEELHEEYAYTPEELTCYLQEAGFSHIKQYGDRKLRAPNDSDERIFFLAQKDLSRKDL
ncbi:MAG: class I SAM-dependent methyltransferase [Oscillospiraceae bacterium]